MQPSLTPLPDFRLPDYPSAPLTLNALPLSIFTSTIPTTNSPEHKTTTIATSIATILYKWHPNALAAFLDTDAWFSTTWSITLPSGTKYEIGRVKNRVTFGTLDPDGVKWDVMLTFDIRRFGASRGKWRANAIESMLGNDDFECAEDVVDVADEWVRERVGAQIWEAAKGVRHGFWVEHAPIDIWGDGIAMNPHWLYAPLDLGCCTACKRRRGEVELGVCARCGTAVYCKGDECQGRDWRVHKWVCNMGLEERGRALRIAECGGMMAWAGGQVGVEDFPGLDDDDEEDEEGGEGGDEMSRNPNFEEPQLKRERRRESNMMVQII